MYYFYLFFFFFFFFFLLIILLFQPQYTYREIIPGLGSVNYGIKLSSLTSASEIESVVFQDLIISDGEGGSPGADTHSAIDFGGSGDSTTAVGFIPQYLDSKKPLNGYFKLFINYNKLDKVNLLFRVVDENDGQYSSAATKLSQYNIGWGSLRIEDKSTGKDTLYSVIVPFKTYSLIDENTSIHKLNVQIGLLSSGTVNSHELQLYSASVYYY